MKRITGSYGDEFEFDGKNSSKEIDLLHEAYGILCDGHSFFEGKEDLFTDKKNSLVFSLEATAQVVCLLDSCITATGLIKDACYANDPSMDFIERCLCRFHNASDHVIQQCRISKQKDKILSLNSSSDSIKAFVNEVLQVNDVALKNALKIYKSLLAICLKLIPDDEDFKCIQNKFKTVEAIWAK